MTTPDESAEMAVLIPARAVLKRMSTDAHMMRVDARMLAHALPENDLDHCIGCAIPDQ